MLYVLSIIFCVIVVSVINVFATASQYGYQPIHMFMWTCIVTVCVIAIDGIFATIVRWLCPQKWFRITKTSFIASKKEARFYEKIAIKKWKDKVLELGSLTNFRKNKIAEPNNNEYVERYILEANYGIGVHACGMLFGFAATVCCPINLMLPIGLPVSIINLFFNFLPFAILRYNLPKLHTLYRINAKREARGQEKKKAS